MLRQLSFLTALVSFTAAHAADVTPCSIIRFEPNKVYTVEARLNHATHVILPEPIAGKPVTGNPTLWNVEAASTHLFIKPTNEDSPDGEGTTITVIGQSNTSYDFVARRVPRGADTCIAVSKDGQLISSGNDWKTSEERRVDSLQGQVSTLQDQLRAAKSDGDARALNALKEYRSQIYTQYHWEGGKGFLGDDVISDVWDDGRFTFIRVKQDNKGVMQVSAKVDGKKELIQYDYDSHQKIYTLAGLYPELTLTYGKSNITIERADNKTSG